MADNVNEKGYFDQGEKQRSPLDTTIAVFYSGG
jgi:hypothetical protein